MTQSTWIQDAWRAREDEEREEIDLQVINRKLDHLLSGVASILEAQASIIEGQVSMEQELQPVLDAINALATEEGDVAVAVKAIVDKVNSGQVVVKADAQQLVEAINGVTDGLKTVVASTESPATTPIEPPAPTASEVPPVGTTVTDPAPTPAVPAEAPAGSPVTTDGGVPAPDGSNAVQPVDPTPVATETPAQSQPTTSAGDSSTQSGSTLAP